MKITSNLLKRLPKVELHCHLDGCLRPETMADLAQKDNISLPSRNADELGKIMKIGQKRGNLEDYIKRFDLTLAVLQNSAALERAAFEYVEDIADENVRYAEIRFSPALHVQKEITMEDAVDAVRKGLKQGEKEFGIKTRIIICGIRSISPSISLKLADLAVRYKRRGVVGFDLAGPEENYPAKKHREAFYLIRNNNVNATIHAGEAYGPASIHQAIHTCGASRIGHGTRLKEDKDLMQFVNNHRITLEICLTSNWHTKSVRSLKSHPFKFYYDQGIRVTLNTDNRLISNTTLTKEFLLAHDMFGLGLHDFREITIIAMKSAFLNHQDRKILIREIANELEQEFGIMPKYIQANKN